MDITSFLIGFKKGKSAGGGSSDDVRYVTFMNGDTVLYVKPVAVGDDCVDILTKGFIETPTKESTVSTVYTYSGWSLTDGGSASSSALSAVTEDRTVYAAFTSAVRYYTINFYDGETLLHTTSTPYGGSASFEYVKEGYIFNGWLPDPSYVISDMDCYAQLIEGISFASASWETLNAVGASGQASSILSVGDTRTETLSNGVSVVFEIIGFDHDDLADGSGKAPITIALKDVYPQKYTINPIETYYNWCSWSAGNTSLRATIRNLMDILPSDLQTIIKSVTKLYMNGNTQGDYSSRSCTDTLWALSQAELFGESYCTDGTQYERYTSDYNNLHVKYNNGTAVQYFTRSSPHAWNEYWAIVGRNGAIASHVQGKVTAYLHFGFCI